MKKRLKVYGYRKNGSFKIWFFMTMSWLNSPEKVRIAKARKDSTCYYCRDIIEKGDRYYKNDYQFCSTQCMVDHYNEKHFIQLVKKEMKVVNKAHHYYASEKIRHVNYNDWMVSL